MDSIRVFVPILPDHFTAFVGRGRVGEWGWRGLHPKQSSVLSQWAYGYILGTVSTELPTRCLLAQLTSGREKITAPCMIEEL